MKRILSTQERERVREEFLKEAGARFEEMFFEGTFEDLVTFTQREDRACAATDKLWQWMMEKHIELDGAMARSEIPSLCPKCKKPGRSREKSGALQKPNRSVVGRRGGIEFERDGYECPGCRILFFSDGSTA